MIEKEAKKLTKTEKKEQTSKKPAKKEKKQPKKKLSEIRPGYLVKVVHLSPDGKRDFTTEGVVIRVRGEGENKTFTVRRIAEGVGVEKVFSFSSPALKELSIIEKKSARRARLYFLRSEKAKGAKKSQYLKG